jgi:glycerate kinase
MTRRFLVAPDSFKGTFAATEVAAAIGRGVAAAGAEADLCPAADGGEGTAAAVAGALGGTSVRMGVQDPLGRSIEADFVLLQDGETAVVDTASASGLPLIEPTEKNAERASTFGTGELIVAAVAAGARTVILAAGGSATTDGGSGAIEALRSGGGLGGASLHILCDVTTPFERAAEVFAPQKGAGPATVEHLAERLDRFAATLPRDPRGVPMSGCAGGLSGGLWAAFGAALEPGADHVLELLGFEARLAAADAVISGEGRLDDQSFTGKIVGRIAAACADAGKPLHLLVGQDRHNPATAAGLSIASVQEAQTLAGLSRAAESIAAC